MAPPSRRALSVLSSSFFCSADSFFLLIGRFDSPPDAFASLPMTAIPMLAAGHPSPIGFGLQGGAEVPLRARRTDRRPAAVGTERLRRRRPLETPLRSTKRRLLLSQRRRALRSLPQSRRALLAPGRRWRTLRSGSRAQRSLSVRRALIAPGSLRSALQVSRDRRRAIELSIAAHRLCAVARRAAVHGPSGAERRAPELRDSNRPLRHAGDVVDGRTARIVPMVRRVVPRSMEDNFANAARRQEVAVMQPPVKVMAGHRKPEAGRRVVADADSDRSERRPRDVSAAVSPGDPRRGPFISRDPAPPAQVRAEDPAPVVERRPAPRVVRDERPSMTRVAPLPVRVRPPARRPSVRDPDETVLGCVDPATVRRQL